MPAILPDRTLNTLLKDVILKGFVVVYESQSPTRNKEAAIKKMLEAGQFIANHGVDMTQEWFDNLGNRSTELIVTQHNLSTRWRDFFTSPVKTYISARDFKADADVFLADAKTASAQAKYNASSELREEKKAKKAARQANAIQPVLASEGVLIVPAHPTVTAPAPFPSSAPPNADLCTGAGDRAYIRFGELEMKIPLDSRTKLHFDGEVLATRFRTGPMNTQDSVSDGQRVGAVKRSASVFTATGTARVVPQQDTVGGDPNQNHLEEVPTTCKFEWLEGPFVTALTELEDGSEPETMESVLDSDPQSD